MQHWTARGFQAQQIAQLQRALKQQSASIAQVCSDVPMGCALLHDEQSLRTVASCRLRAGRRL
jgi:hypothetical protein